MAPRKTGMRTGTKRVITPIKNTTTRTVKAPLSSSYVKYKQWIAQGRPGGKFIP